MLFIDIETLPSTDKDRIAQISAGIKPPANYKSAEAISKWEREKKTPAVEKAVHDTGFCGTVGSICCICWSIDDGEIQSVDNSQGEKSMLATFITQLHDEIGNRRPTWVGHYITGFDLRFLWQRCVINEVRQLVKIPYSAKPWDSEVFDTKIEWDGVKSSGFGTLDSISKALGYGGKQGMTGADVWDYYKQGRLAEIVEYCKNDVDLARKLYRRMTA